MGSTGLLSIRELAELMSVSARSVMRMDQTGKLPAPVMLGRCKRWNRRELVMWIDYGSPPRIKWQPIWYELRDRVKSA